MFVPGITSEIEYMDKGSRFLSRCWNVEDRKAAEVKISEVRAEHPKATHVVYAFTTGGGKAEILGQSDDGEPKGTSGRPTLEVIKGSGLVDALITTVRYFGGTKLGTGGLVRAYTKAAQLALEATEKQEVISMTPLEFSLDYGFYDIYKRVESEYRIEPIQEIFTERIVIKLEMDSTQVMQFRDEIRERSSGAVHIYLEIDTD